MARSYSLAALIGFVTLLSLISNASALPQTNRNPPVVASRGWYGCRTRPKNVGGVKTDCILRILGQASDAMFLKETAVEEGFTNCLKGIPGNQGTMKLHINWPMFDSRQGSTIVVNGPNGDEKFTQGVAACCHDLPDVKRLPTNVCRVNPGTTFIREKRVTYSAGERIHIRRVKAENGAEWHRPKKIHKKKNVAPKSRSPVEARPA